MKVRNLIKGSVTLMFTLVMGVMSASAQESTGDLYHGLTKKVTYDRMIPPHGIEVTYDSHYICGSLTPFAN